VSVQLVSEISDLCDPDPPTSQTDGQTDGRTDGQTTCNLNTALCTKVHRAVKSLQIAIIRPQFQSHSLYLICCEDRRKALHVTQCWKWLSKYKRRTAALLIMFKW